MGICTCDVLDRRMGRTNRGTEMTLTIYVALLIAIGMPFVFLAVAVLSAVILGARSDRRGRCCNGIKLCAKCADEVARAIAKENAK